MSKKSLKNDEPVNESVGVSATKMVLPEEVDEYSRRQILQTGMSLTGYVALGSLLNPTAAKAQTTSYPPQKKLVWINMQGAWDILEVTDPKTASTAGIQMAYTWDQASTLAGSGGTVKIGRWLPSIAAQGADVVVVRRALDGNDFAQCWPSIYGHRNFK